MAYATRELVSSITQAAKKRFWPTSIQVKSFKNIALGPTLAVGTPIAFDTSTLNWVVWAQAGTNGTNQIRGFVWPDDVKLDATNEVMGQVMMAGKLDYADVVLPAGETDPNLKLELQDNLRQFGFHVEGLPEVR